VEETLPDGGMMAVAHDGHHVTAVVAQMLNRFLAHHVPLVRHQDREDQDEDSDDQRDGPALEASVRRLKGEEAQQAGHARASTQGLNKLGRAGPSFGSGRTAGGP